MAEPRRPRRFLAVNGFPPAPRWAWVVMTASLLAIAVLSYLALHRPPPPGYRASPSPAATGSEGAVRLRRRPRARPPRQRVSSSWGTGSRRARRRVGTARRGGHGWSAPTSPLPAGRSPSTSLQLTAAGT